jgi:PAS domain S-box-containing protein
VLDDTTGAVLLTTEALQGGQGSHLVAVLNAQPAWSDLPVICLTSARMRAARDGSAPHALLLSHTTNVLVLERPTGRDSLLSAVRSALKNRARQFRLRDELERMAQHAEELRLSRQNLVAANLRREFLFRLVREQRESSSAGTIMQLAAEALRAKFAANRCGFYTVQAGAGGGGCIQFGPSSQEAGLPPLAGSLPLDALDPALVRKLGASTVARYGELVEPGCPAAAVATHYRIEDGVILQFHRERRWEGGLYITHPARHPWDDSEIGLFEEAGHLAWDAVERAESETALKEREIQLVRTEERDRLWQLSRDLLGIFDAEGRWRSVNPAWTQRLGWSASELLAQGVDAFVHPDDLPPTRQWMQQLFVGGQPGSFENRLRTRDGGFRTLSWSAVPMHGLVYSAARDVTEQRAQALALQQAEDQLRQSQKMEALGQLTGGIAHDFNNMLQGITMSLEVLKRRLALGHSDNDRFIESAMRSCVRAAAVTHHLLAFSRRQPLRPSQVELNGQLRSMSDLIRQTVGEQITWRYDLDPAVAAVTCDPNQLENAMLNLVINARDALPHGGEIVVFTRANGAPHGSAVDAAAATEHFAALGVRDNGVGMPPDVAKRAFDPFFTTKPIGKGTGLGLSMIYGFAKQSRGDCVIDSMPGAGTTVTIFLPLATDEPSAPVPGHSLAEDRHISTGTVLVVEDDEVVRPLVIEALRNLGLRVLEARDGPAGLKILQSEEAIDVLVTDVGLPGLNGRQLADAAAAHRPALKVLFMTGYADAMLDMDGLLNRGMCMLAKPFKLNDLTAKVCTLLLSHGAPH